MGVSRIQRIVKLERPHFDDNGDCKCPSCCCQCAILYHRSEKKKLTAQAKQKIIESMSTKSQSKIDIFWGSLMLLPIW